MADGERGGRRREGQAWEAGLRAELRRIATEADEAGGRLGVRDLASGTAGDVVAGPSVAGSVLTTLREVAAMLDAYGAERWWRRLFGAGRTYELALGRLHQARQDLLLVAEDAAVVAQVPTLRAGVKAYLVDDPRSDGFLRYLDRWAPGGEAAGADGRDEGYGYGSPGLLR